MPNTTAHRAVLLEKCRLVARQEMKPWPHSRSEWGPNVSFNSPFLAARRKVPHHEAVDVHRRLRLQRGLRLRLRKALFVFADAFHRRDENGVTEPGTKC
jgi:hypothetical protein